MGRKIIVLLMLIIVIAILAIFYDSTKPDFYIDKIYSLELNELSISLVHRANTHDSWSCNPVVGRNITCSFFNERLKINDDGITIATFFIQGSTVRADNNAWRVVAVNPSHMP